MRTRWLALAVVLVVLAGGLLLAAPLGPVLREARQSSLLLEQLLSKRQLEGALAILAARTTANAWSWPQVSGGDPWRPCPGQWPCPRSAEPTWVLYPDSESVPGLEPALLFRCLVPECPGRLAAVELRVRAAAGERRLGLLGWRPPDLSGFGGGWLKREAAAAAETSSGEPGCDLSALVLGHRPPRAECMSPPPSEDEVWLARLAEPIAEEALCAARPEIDVPLLWVGAGASLSCLPALKLGTAEAPVLMVLDLPASIAAGSALELTGALLLRNPTNTALKLRVDGRLSVRGLLAAEGELDVAGEFNLHPDGQALRRLRSRTLWRRLDFGSEDGAGDGL